MGVALTSAISEPHCGSTVISFHIGIEQSYGAIQLDQNQAAITHHLQTAEKVIEQTHYHAAAPNSSIYSPPNLYPKSPLSSGAWSRRSTELYSAGGARMGVSQKAYYLTKSITCSEFGALRPRTSTHRIKSERTGA